MSADPIAGGLRRPLDGARVAAWFRDHWISFAAAAVLIWIVVIPLIYLIIFSFRSGTAAAPGDWTLANYALVYTSKMTHAALGNTLIYTLMVATLSMAIAGGLAWLVERTDMPYRGAAWVMILLPIAMPGMLSSMAWILLLGPRTGLINVMLRTLLAPFGYDSPSGPINIYSMEGMIFVESVRGSTTLFLMLVAGFRLMDPALEEAASMSGARTGYTLRKITLPLMLPMLLATWMYSFIGTLDDFETPLLIGLPAQIYLLPTVIYFTAYLSSSWGLAAAYATIFLLISIVLVVVYHRVVLRRTSQFATVSGKAFRPRQIELGRMRWLALGMVVLYFVLAVLLPLLILILASLLPFYRVPSLDMFGELTLANYQQLFSNTRVLRAAGNSLWVSFWVASGTMILAFLLAWVIVRQRVPGRMVLDSIAFIPHAIPAVVVAVAMIMFYLSPAMQWSGLYGGLIVLSLALVTRFIAFASRTSNAAMTQIDASLEEAAYVSGARKARVLARILFPLLLPTFVAGWIFVAANAFRNLNVSLLLSTPQNELISVTLYDYWERQADFSMASTLGVVLVVGLAVLTVLARQLIARGYSGND
ncbi:MAG: ABC transporter permease [Alphaproteobacteria bacterium]